MNRPLLRFSWLLLAMGVTIPSVAEDWPRWRGPTADGVWTETGIAKRFAGPQVPIRWRAKVGPGYTGPTVADGRVFVMDRQVEGTRQSERVLCFEAATGRSLWTHQYACAYSKIGYQAGPRACVTIDGDRAFALGAMGHLHCLDAATGKVLWQHDCNQEYRIDMPIWGIAASPVVDHDLVIVLIGGQDACVVAFHQQDGREVWRALSDRAQYSTPVLVQQAGIPVLICWTGDSIAGLAPQTGKVLWRHAFPPNKMPIGVASPVVQGDRVFLTSFYDGSLMLRLKQDQPGVDVLWKRTGASERQTDALHSIISTPVFAGEFVYGVDSYGEMRCLKAENGDRVWENLTATPKSRWSTIHFVQNGDQHWLFNERGELLIGRLSPAGFQETSRAKLLEPTLEQLNQRGGVCWSHPAFAGGHVFARNDAELVCGSLLTADQSQK